MRLILSGLSALAACVLIVVSAGLNYRFMASLARTPDEAMIMGVAAVAGDVLKACLPSLLVLAWQGRRLVFVGVGVPMLIILSGVSLLAALGNAADMRGGTANARDTRSQALAVAEEKLRDIKSAETGRALPRAPAELDAELSMLRQDRRWQTSRECAEATVGASREFCAGYFRLLAAHAASVEHGKRVEQMAKLEAEIVVLRSAGAGEEAEPQVAILAGLSGGDRGSVRTALIVVSALFIELGSGLGLYLALNHSPRRRESTKGPGRASPLALPNLSRPSAAARIEDYAVARLVPARGRALSVSEAYGDYLAWSRSGSEEPLQREAFEALFAALASDLGIARCGAGFRDVGLGGVAPSSV